MQRLFEELAPLYADLEGRREGIQEQCQALLNLAREHGPVENILDLGCGTGEHLAALSGLVDPKRLLGVDIAPAMIRVARERYPGIRFEPGDMRALGLIERFDLIISLFGCLNYLHSDEELLAALTGARERLKPGGRLLFEVWHRRPYAGLDYSYESPPRLVQSQGLAVERRRQVRRISRDRNDFIDIDFTYRLEPEGRFVRDRHRFRVFDRGEFEKLAGEAGLVLLELRSRFEKPGFEELSGRMIVLLVTRE
ncbi:MAG: class I SAM-dependent methyltransferase [Spirochaetales bacterium]|nr:class I SAM-dependent methyltransferase [Leptospiraceae bacterium]MCP5483447.1 class I SAM-dependent methyltransferase [Spirochaetales bacterium]MCP5486565.1 class I SAM-dependent methyltransferase [Spirochaetales bacterium]